MSQLDSNAIKEIVKLTTTAFSGENLPLTECLLRYCRTM